MVAVKRHATPAMHPPGPRGHNPIRSGCNRDGGLVSYPAMVEVPAWVTVGLLVVWIVSVCVLAVVSPTAEERRRGRGRRHG